MMFFSLKFLLLLQNFMLPLLMILLFFTCLLSCRCFGIYFAGAAGVATCVQYLLLWFPITSALHVLDVL
jgi:hypothetical protein